MYFKKRKIRSTLSSSTLSSSKDSFLYRLRKKIFTPQIIVFLTAFLILGTFIFGIFQALRGFNLQKVLFLLGADLEEDAYGHTNILLLGTGTQMHEGSDLTDTIMVAGIDQETKKVTLLSIPRDLYIKDQKFGGMRINNLYYTAKKILKSPEIGIELTKEHVEEVLGIKIQYYAKIDFEGFVEVINQIDGIDLEIPETIFDPLYPKGETGQYETFFISQGQSHLDGETALKYVRSRETTSDFSRSQRQQKILLAIKEKAEKSGILKDKDTLEEIYNTLRNKIETNLGIRDLIRLAEIGTEINTEINTESIQNYLVHDDPSKCGGFLYPGERNLYGGAFVFIPAGESFEPIRKMANIVLGNSGINKIKLQILNGTNRSFLAGKTKVILKRHCIDVVRYGNGRSTKIATTTYFRKKNTPGINTMISLLQQFIPGEISDQTPPEYIAFPYESDADIILELGNNYLRYEMEDPFDYIVELNPAPKDSHENPEGAKKNETKNPETSTLETDPNEIKLPKEPLKN